MKTLFLGTAVLAVVATANLSPAMANRLGPFDTRLTDWSDMLGQNGINAATTTADGSITNGNTTTAVTGGRDIGSQAASN